jgi:SHS2 domain-containing protein
LAGSWEHFHHEADIGVRGRGDSLAEAFARAAEGMTAVVTDPDTIRPLEAVDIHCEAPDPELLLADWLNALVLEMAVRRMLFSRYDVSIDGGRLDARAWGEPVDRDRHQPVVEIKGATYTELGVRREGDAWMAQAVLDV